MSWICPKCETENPDTMDFCEVCDSLHIANNFNDIPDDEKSWYSKAVMYDDVITKRAYILSKYDGNAYKEIIKYASNLLISADNGNPNAQYMLGDLFISHRSMIYKANAFIWFAKAANQGNGNAMDKLAFCYEKGFGTSKDYSLAKRWYENAINKDCELKEDALQGLHRIQKIISKDVDKVSSPREVLSIKQPFSFTAKYYIAGRSKSYSGSELACKGLPKGTMVRKMLSDEWVPIERFEIPKPHISESSYYYARGMKGVFRLSQLRSMLLPKTHLIREMFTELWFPIGDL